MYSNSPTDYFFMVGLCLYRYGVSSEILTGKKRQNRWVRVDLLLSYRCAHTGVKKELRRFIKANIPSR